MNDYGVAELVLLALGDETVTGEMAPPGTATASELGDALGLGETMADQLTLLSAASSLTGNDLVRETTDRVADRSGERSVYQLTDEGRRRAGELWSALEEERVTVHDGDDAVECRLTAVPNRFDVSVPEAIVRRSPTGDLTLGGARDDGIVGRDAELDRLDAVLADAFDGRPRTAVVTGDAGVGKTTLVEAFGDRARDRDVDVLVGRSRREGGEPYGPIRDAIEGELGAAADLPFAAGDRAEAEGPEMYEAQLAALYYQVTAMLADHARETPTVLVVEDLQWADAATVDLLAHVAAEIADAPLLLVATYRPSGVDDEEPLGPRLAERSADDRLVALAVEPFDRERTAALIEAELGRRGVPADFVDAIHEGTGGNPLFVVETIAQLRESGALDPRVNRYPDAVDDVEIPSVVGTMIERRFARLDEDTRQVLEVGAVLGDPMSERAVLAIASLPEPTVRERIDLLVDGGLWVRDGDDRIRFRSEVLRSTALETIGDSRRRALNRAAAARLADEGAGPATVASHYERAGEPERALEHYRRAADDATEVYAHELAVDHYERALGLARDQGREEVVLDLLEALGDIHYTRGEYDAAAKHFRYVRERTDEPERMRRSFYYQSRMHFERSAFGETEESARRGLEVGGDEITEVVCWLVDYLGSSFMKRGRHDEAIEQFERQRELAAEIDFTLSLGRAFQNLGNTYRQMGEMQRAVEHAERGADLLEATDDGRELARCLNDLGIVYSSAGDYDVAVETLERCGELAERSGNVRAKLLAKTNLAVFAGHRGEWELMFDLYDEVRTLADRAGDDVSKSLAIWNESVIEMETGSVGDAIEGFESARELLQDSEANQRIAHYEWGLGAAYFLAADFDRAEEHLDRARDIATDYEFTRTVGACKSIRGAIERERGEIERAIELQREGLELVAGLDDDYVRALRANRLARTLIHAGNIDEALTLARDTCERMTGGNPQTAVKVDATYGAAQLAAGDREAAQETLETTLERARDLSNEALVIALRELGRLATKEGDAELGRERLEEGRAVAEEAGMDVFRPHFDELLADLDGPSTGRPAETAVGDGDGD